MVDLGCQLESKAMQQKFLEKRGNNKNKNSNLSNFIEMLAFFFIFHFPLISPGVTITELQKRGGLNEEAYQKVHYVSSCVMKALCAGIFYPSLYHCSTIWRLVFNS